MCNCTHLSTPPLEFFLPLKSLQISSSSVRSTMNADRNTPINPRRRLLDSRSRPIAPLPIRGNFSTPLLAQMHQANSVRRSAPPNPLEMRPTRQIATTTPTISPSPAPFSSLPRISNAPIMARPSLLPDASHHVSHGLNSVSRSSWTSTKFTSFNASCCA